MGESIKVMVNGLPGKMATNVVEHIINNPLVETEMYLIPYSLTGPDITEKKVPMGPGTPLIIYLIKPSERENRIEEITRNIRKIGISVDYTHPNAINDNVDFYCRNNLPFVMGTTGGDRDALEQRVKDSDISAVIAPNMAKQIVAFQAMMQYAAETFPNVFKDYKLKITESHQQGKADTSGTAKAMVEYFNALGIPFTKDQIEMIRDPSEQIMLGVPKEALRGHGWHTYTLLSTDEDVLFRFTHNVNGRDVYALGTLDAIRFLDKKVKAGEKGRVYSMIDVLKG